MTLFCIARIYAHAIVQKGGCMCGWVGEIRTPEPGHLFSSDRVSEPTHWAARDTKGNNDVFQQAPRTGGARTGNALCAPSLDTVTPTPRKQFCVPVQTSQITGVFLSFQSLLLYLRIALDPGRSLCTGAYIIDYGCCLFFAPFSVSAYCNMIKSRLLRTSLLPVCLCTALFGG